MSDTPAAYVLVCDCCGNSFKPEFEPRYSTDFIRGSTYVVCGADFCRAAYRIAKLIMEDHLEGHV